MYIDVHWRTLISRRSPPSYCLPTNCTMSLAAWSSPALSRARSLSRVTRLDMSPRPTPTTTTLTGCRLSSTSTRLVSWCTH